jgi:lysophospholipase L1-like esterase
MKRLIALAAVCLMAISANAQQKEWANFKRFKEANAEVTTAPKAVFMGDSITEGWARIDADFFKNNNFVGRGISGQVTSQMLVRFRQDVLELNPKYVVIMAGTNDIALNNGPIELKNVLDNLKSMCELAKFHKKKVILCSVPPANRFGWRKELKPADDIIKLNEMIKEYAASAKIPYVDYHSAIKDSENGLPAQYAKDGVHPNLECYKIMEEIVMKYIK